MIKTIAPSPMIEPFEVHTSRYEKWFEDHKAVYQSELDAIRFILPQFKWALEVGVGTGRFSQPFGVHCGVDPARNALQLARARGIEVVQGVGEELPYTDNSFDLVLIVTTICFFLDLASSLKEAFRVLKPNGSTVIGFVDKNSTLGRIYEERRVSPFYASAHFYGVDEVVGLLSRSGFVNLSFVQTIYKSLEEIKEVEPVKQGYGEGSFVVVYARKPPNV